MHAFLLINTDPYEFAKNKAQKIIPFGLQKIEDSRELKKLIRFSFSEETAIIINNIDNATVEACNALLKNIEEPVPNLIFIITANNLHNVLPTIISRCKIVKSQKTIGKILNTNLNYKDALNIKDRDEAIVFIQNLVELDYQKRIFTNMEIYLKTIKDLKTNGNVSLQMTTFVVRMNGHGR